MRTKLGFVVFIFAFIISAVVIPLIERIPRILQGTVQSVSLVGERCIQGVRFAAKKLSMAEAKNVAQRLRDDVRS